MHPRRTAGFTGWEEISGASREVFTPRGFFVRGDRLWLTCTNRPVCYTPAWKADLSGYIDKGWGDVPIDAFRAHWKCPKCGAGKVATSRATKEEYGPDRGGYRRPLHAQ
jgi:hypothetical protein